MTASTTFPMTSHPKVKPTTEAQLRAELTRLHTALTAHRDKMPHWSDITARAKWVSEKDQIITGIGLVEGQLRNRWQEVEVSR